ncbi:MAG TPA: DASS family sodium-coupled anion symporter, partial [Xanthobacteraceae bacterium]|nr:DASS family sodium-coupled anion symporter [Xanthobacteraceae bacterium]
ATAALSMWISNTATTVMMLPIALSLIAVILPPDSELGRDRANFGGAMMLGVAYAASIGGMATLIGSPPNALAASYLEQTFQVQISFAEWMAIALPITAPMLILAYLTLTRLTFPFSKSLAGTETHIVADMLRDMGPVSAPEKRVAIVFTAVSAAWIFHPLYGDRIGVSLTDTGIAVAGAIALFVIPADWRNRLFLLDLATARKAPFDILILFGGGLSLAHAIDSSGLDTWIGNGLSFLHGTHLFLLIAATVLLVVFATELMSNTATAAAFLPIAGSLAMGAEIAALPIVVAVGLAASCAFMLPVATLPNALVYGTGQVALPQMLRAGFMLSLIGAAVIAAGIVFAVQFLP